MRQGGTGSTYMVGWQAETEAERGQQAEIETLMSKEQQTVNRIRRQHSRTDKQRQR
jgi:hypothetical protein